MDNFFRKVTKENTNTSYHSPYTYLSANTKDTKQVGNGGDFFTILWLETAALTIFMSAVVILPTVFWS